MGLLQLGGEEVGGCVVSEPKRDRSGAIRAGRIHFDLSYYPGILKAGVAFRERWEFRRVLDDSDRSFRLKHRRQRVEVPFIPSSGRQISGPQRRIFARVVPVQGAHSSRLWVCVTFSGVLERPQRVIWIGQARTGAARVYIDSLSGLGYEVSRLVAGLLAVPRSVVEVAVVVGDLGAFHPVDRHAAVAGGRGVIAGADRSGRTQHPKL